MHHSTLRVIPGTPGGFAFDQLISTTAERHRNLELSNIYCLLLNQNLLWPVKLKVFITWVYPVWKRGCEFDWVLNVEAKLFGYWVFIETIELFSTVPKFLLCKNVPPFCLLLWFSYLSKWQLHALFAEAKTLIIFFFSTFHAVRWAHWLFKIHPEMGTSHHLSGYCLALSPTWTPCWKPLATPESVFGVATWMVLSEVVHQALAVVLGFSISLWGLRTLPPLHTMCFTLPGTIFPFEKALGQDLAGCTVCLL